MDFIKSLEWRYATKSFDNSKKISETNINILKRAIQLSPVSYGLQLYKVIIISDDQIKQRLKPYSWNQNQITDCSHLFIFCNYTEISRKDIDDYITSVENINNLKLGELSEYGNFIKIKIDEKSAEQKINWLQQQPYISIGFLLSACAILKVDACPMEGFEPERYNELLGLNAKNLNALALVAVGYRDTNDKAKYRPKVRKPFELLFDSM